MNCRKPLKSSRPVVNERVVKRDLLNAAVRLMSAHGRKAATARTICSEAGVGAPALYHHYGDLAGLHKAAIDESFRQVAATYRRTTKTRGPLQGILDSWALLIQFAHEEPLMCRTVVQHILAGEPPRAVAGLLGSLAKDLTSLEAQGALNYSGEFTAQLLWASALGSVCFTIEQGNSKRSYPAIQKSMVRAILKLLFKTTAGKKKLAKTSP